MKTNSGKHTKGQASLVLVLILGFAAIVSVLASSSIGVSTTQIESAIVASNQAWYAAWGGVDELMYRLRSQQDFGPDPYTINLEFDNGATVSATISGDNSSKIVTAIGYADRSVRKLEVQVASSSSKASFIFAAQSGEGGFELVGSAFVSGADGVDGNVYSNGNVLGTRASPVTSASTIKGSVWAVGYIGGLSSPGSGGVRIEKNVHAGALSACLVLGDVTSPLPPSNCPYSGTFTLGEPPPAVALSSVDADYWKTQAAAAGPAWIGNCNIGAVDGTDCSSETKTIGNLKIQGDLNLPSNTNLTINGPVWVEGNFTIGQNNSITAAETLGQDSVVLVASDTSDPANQGRIVTASNVQYNLNSQGAGLIFISENTSTVCDSSSAAISSTSNTATVVLVAEDGCINIGTNSVISGILGYKVRIENNSSVQYDPNLAQAIISTDSGGWAVTNVREF